MCECDCVLAKEGDEEKARNKDPSVSKEQGSLPFHSEPLGDKSERQLTCGTDSSFPFFSFFCGKEGGYLNY